jgi:hypothetical protein
VFGISLPRGIFGDEGEKVAEEWKELHNVGSITCTLHKILD